MRYRHFRGLWGGAATAAYDPNTMIGAVSVCAKADQFSRKEGRRIAEERIDRILDGLTYRRRAGTAVSVVLVLPRLERGHHSGNQASDAWTWLQRIAMKEKLPTMVFFEGGGEGRAS